MAMKPIRIFLFFLTVFFALLSVSFLVEDKEIEVTEDVMVRIPDIRELFFAEEGKYAEIASILEFARDIDSEDLSSLKSSSSLLDSSGLRDTAAMAQDSLEFSTDSMPGLEYFDSEKMALFSFFQALQQIAVNGQGLHIMHYGDSQLEGDRISDYLRTRLQNEFGGSGPGLFPIDRGLGRLYFTTSISDNWTKYSFANRKTTGKKVMLGPLASLFKFGSWRNDSLGTGYGYQKAWFKVAKFGKAKDKIQDYTRCRLFISGSDQPVIVDMAAGKTRRERDTIHASTGCTYLSYSFDDAPESLTFHFESAGSPSFSGISLDNPEGISVDNIPLRGSSGLEFTKMNPALLRTLFSSLNVKLLIIQFGANLIAGTPEYFRNYEKSLSAQLRFIKSIYPDVCILVIGSSDAACKIGGSYESYPHIEALIEAQRNAAFKNGCAFWNLYQKMGGRNSMVSWVNADPTLATTDFIHFNHSGARVVGKLLFNDLMYDYRDFLRSKRGRFNPLSLGAR